MGCRSSRTSVSKPSSSGKGALLLFLTLLVACQEELPSRTGVAGLRILAIRADPPEVSPGFPSIISALVADPWGEGRSLDWALTLCTPDTVNGGCLEYNYLLEIYPNTDVADSYYAQCCIRSFSETPLHGVLEVGPGVITGVVTSDRMLEGLDERAAEEGVNAQVTVLLCESGVCTSAVEDPEGGSSTDVTLSLPPEQSAPAVKRVRVSSSEAWNLNPELESLEIDGIAYEKGDDVQLEAGGSYVLIPRLEPGSIEDYTYVLSDGTVEERTESPYFSWYADQGEFEEAFSDATDGSEARNTWTAPAIEDALSPELHLYVVVWDRRGGIDWLYLTVELTGGE